MADSGKQQDAHCSSKQRSHSSESYNSTRGSLRGVEDAGGESSSHPSSPFFIRPNRSLTSHPSPAEWNSSTVSNLVSESRKVKTNSQRKSLDEDGIRRDGGNSGRSQTSGATVSVPHGELEAGSSIDSTTNVETLAGEGGVTTAAVVWRRDVRKRTSMGAGASNHHLQSQEGQPRTLEVRERVISAQVMVVCTTRVHK